jgi:MMP 1-O-methyltransferase
MVEMDSACRHLAMRAKGWMPDDQGMMLWRTAYNGLDVDDLAVEVGAYCGKSTIYLGDACRQRGARLYSVDHHRGSPEHQKGQPFFDPETYFEPLDVVDTLPSWRANITYAGLEDTVIGVVGDSKIIGDDWAEGSLRLLFIDGGHESAQVKADYDAWMPTLEADGFLLLHDVDPGVGPYEVWKQAHNDGFHEIFAQGSLKVLTRS